MYSTGSTQAILYPRNRLNNVIGFVKSHLRPHSSSINDRNIDLLLRKMFKGDGSASDTASDRGYWVQCQFFRHIGFFSSLSADVTSPREARLFFYWLCDCQNLLVLPMVLQINYTYDLI